MMQIGLILTHDSPGAIYSTCSRCTDIRSPVISCPDRNLQMQPFVTREIMRLIYA
jgi:hypothetical protein